MASIEKQARIDALRDKIDFYEDKLRNPYSESTGLLVLMSHTLRDLYEELEKLESGD